MDRDRPSSPTGRKRSLRRAFAGLGDNAYPSKQQKQDRPASNRKKRSHEIIVLDDADDWGGAGTNDNPYVLSEWTTGNVISKYLGAHFAISDDDGDEVGEPETTEVNGNESGTLGGTDYADLDLALLTVHRPGWRRFGSEALAQRSVDRGEESDDDAPIASSEIRRDSRSSLRVHSDTSNGTPPRQQSVSNDYDVSVDEDQDGGPDEDCDCIIVFETSKPATGVSQPWTIHIKDEPDDLAHVPSLTTSQETVASEDFEGSSALDEHSGWHARYTDRANEFFPLAERLHPEAPIGTGETCSQGSSTEIHVPQKAPKPVVFRGANELAEGLNWDEPLPLPVRKRLFFETYRHLKHDYLEREVQEYEAGVVGSRLHDECWLYKGPRFSVDRSRTLRIGIRFRHNGRTENISMHIVFISMLLKGLLSEEQIEGIVNHSWHASHLCGNWTCLNPRHVIPEAGSVNLSRNPCFRDVNGPCEHTPKCLKHLKLDLQLLRPSPKEADLEVANGDA